ncbi:MAG: hypothetical protein HY791_01445 [Deltaproteobacteria bacterium]|nr:hypothetical protein [Deltaproteobacteria bacterium]
MPDRQQEEKVALTPWDSRLELASSKRRLTELLDRPDADQAIAALSEGECYYLVKELGIDDAHPILAVMTAEQIRALVDLDTWHKDRLQIADALTWLSAFADVSSEKLYEAANSIDFELLGLILRRRLLVCSAKLPEEEHPLWVKVSDDVIETPDGRFFLGSRPIDEEDVEAEDELEGPSLDEDERKAVLQIVEKLYKTEDWEFIARALRLAETDSSPNLEEDALRFRNARIEDLGFPPRERAIEVYGPLDPAELQSIEADVATTDLRLPALYAEQFSKRGLLHDALATISDGYTVERIEGELVPLANAIMMADRVAPGDLEGLSRSLERLVGNLTIAIGHEAPEGRKVELARERLEHKPLRSLFRVGHTLTIRVADRARKLVATSVFARGRDRLALLSTKERSIVEALLLQRPAASPELFGKPGLSRPFQSSEELDEAQRALDQVEAQAKILARHSAPKTKTYLPEIEWTSRVLVATIAANAALGQAVSATPIAAAELEELAEALSGKDALERAMAALEANDDATRKVVTSAIEELMEELRPRPIDPRMVHTLLIEKS